MFRTHFCGNEISDYGREHGRVDYRALAKSFNCVLCNSLLGYRDGFDEWELIQGVIDNSEEIEEKRERLEELEAKLKDLAEKREEADDAVDRYESASSDIYSLIEAFDAFEGYAGEVLEGIRYGDFETPNGEELDAYDLKNAIERLDFWELREPLEEYQETIEDALSEAQEKRDELDETIESFEKECEELEGEIEELEAEEDETREVFQWYVIDDNGAQILEEYTNEILYYNEELDLYLWGVTHWGTSWDYVLTSIRCETFAEEEAREAEEAKGSQSANESIGDMVDELIELWQDDSEEPEDLEEAVNLAVAEAVAEELEETAETVEEPEEDKPKWYKVSWNNGSAHHSNGFESEEERDKFRERLESDPQVANISTWEC